MPVASSFSPVARSVFSWASTKRIQGAADLAAIAGHFGHAALVAVQLFEHHHGQEDVVLFKAEQAGGVVQQHIGVQNK